MNDFDSSPFGGAFKLAFLLKDLRALVAGQAFPFPRFRRK